MSKYRRKPEIIEAIQWFKPGDHPDVHPFGKCFFLRCPDGTDVSLKDAGEVRPGDYILTHADGRREVAWPARFHERYEPIDESEAADG